MPPTTTLPPRHPPSPIVDAIQRSPVLSPRVTEQRQQRSGSVRPPSPPQRPPTPPQPSLDQKTENGSKDSEPIDQETFDQILELDDYDFAWEMAVAYMVQAKGTFEDMEAAIAKKDCKKLSSLGHFLKGSSATLGVVGVRNSCELIQHYGDLKDNETGKDLTAEVALAKISVALKEGRAEYKEAEKWLNKWYEDAKAQGRITAEEEDEDE